MNLDITLEVFILFLFRIQSYIKTKGIHYGWIMVLLTFTFAGLVCFVAAWSFLFVKNSQTKITGA